MFYQVCHTPIGIVTVVANERAVVALHFGTCEVAHATRKETALLRETKKQLAAYFSGERHEFTVPLEPIGTPFQQSVWHALRHIPYGHTTNYGAIAQQIGRPKAARAVGMANNRNPIPIIIPCHRVVGANGALVGYGGGLALKRQLLDIEQRTKK